MLTMHHIPVCPFSQRVEILLALKGLRDLVRFEVVDITRPRNPALLAKTRGTTALPVLELEDGRIIKESLVILRYLEDRFAQDPVQRSDPYERAVEGMLCALEGDFVNAGYRAVMNQSRDRRDEMLGAVTAQYAKLDAFLRQHAPDGPFLFERFGFAECVFTPMFMRFSFLAYYEDFDVRGDDFACVRAWRDACLAHPAAQQLTAEEIIKLYFDYALGYGNGALPEGRRVSSFAFQPHWSGRPMPPRAKYEARPSDAALGLV
jgi:glutathione S-transferase